MRSLYISNKDDLDVFDSSYVHKVRKVAGLPIKLGSLTCILSSVEQKVVCRFLNLGTLLEGLIVYNSIVYFVSVRSVTQHLDLLR